MPDNYYTDMRRLVPKTEDVFDTGLAYNQPKPEYTLEEERAIARQLPMLLAQMLGRAERDNWKPSDLRAAFATVGLLAHTGELDILLMIARAQQEGIERATREAILRDLSAEHMSGEVLVRHTLMQAKDPKLPDVTMVIYANAMMNRESLLTLLSNAKLPDKPSSRVTDLSA